MAMINFGANDMALRLMEIGSHGGDVAKPSTIV